MIYGLTHDKNTGQAKDTTQYFGKISTGYAAGEGPNKTNHPVGCGFYRILVQKQIRVPQSGGKSIVVEKWAENPDVHNKVGKEPMALKFVCVGKHPSEIWQSRMAYWANGRIKCAGNGKTAVFYEDMGDGTVISKDITCPYHECPHFKEERCKAEGRLKVGLVDDYHLTSMYRLDTKSINSILSIESSLMSIYETLERLHIMTRAPMSKFYEKGMQGMILRMSLKPKKSGKHNVFITYIEIPPETEKILTDALIKAMGDQSFISIGKDSADVIKITGGDSEPIAGDTEAMVENTSPEVVQVTSQPEVVKVEIPQTANVLGSAKVDVVVGNVEEVKPEIVVNPADVLAKMQQATSTTIKPGASPISFNSGD